MNERSPQWEHMALVAAERARVEDPDGYAEDVVDLETIDAAGPDNLDGWSSTGGDVPPSRRLEIRGPRDLSLAVAETRFRCGLTQDEMAREVALDRAMLARIESGPLPVIVDRAIRVLRRHGASIHVVLPPLPPDPDGGSE